MTHPFQWKRSPKSFLTTVRQIAEEKFPGKKHGEFTAPDGSIVKKNSNGKITMQGARNIRSIVLKRERNFFYN